VKNPACRQAGSGGGLGRGKLLKNKNRFDNNLGIAGKCRENK